MYEQNTCMHVTGRENITMLGYTDPVLEPTIWPAVFSSPKQNLKVN